LRAVADRRDLTLPPPPDSGSASIATAVVAFGAEFADYAGLIGDAHDAVRRNAELLAGMVASSARQDELVRHTAAAVGDVSAEASQMAATVELLRRLVGDASSAGGDAATALATVSHALESLQGGLAAAEDPLGRIGNSLKTLGHMLLALSKLADRADLLAVNAAIEAAHVGDSGTRFAIVASEVRAVSASTRQAATDVQRIAVDLRAAARSVIAATAASARETDVTAGDVARSRASLTDAHQAVAELERTVAAIGSASAEQSAALGTVAGSVDEIASHAAAAMRATADAGALNLDAQLRSAAEGVRRWTASAGVAARSNAKRTIAADVASVAERLGPNEAVFTSQHTAPNHAVSAAQHTAPNHAVSAAQGTAPDNADAVVELRALREAIDADQRAILAELVQLAVSVAYNGVAWRAIESALAALRSEVQQVRQTVAESAVAARSANDASSSMQTVVASMKDRYDEAMSSLDRGLAAIADVEAAVADADRRVAEMTSAVDRTNEIVTLIAAVSADTTVLSLNAAIESARAGATGRPFSIIAGEIRRLASATQDVTVGVSSVIARVADESALVRSAVAAVGGRAHTVTEAAREVRTAVGTLRSALEQTLRAALDVSHAAESQVRGLESVLDNATRSASALDAAHGSQTGDHRLELYALGDRAHRIAARRGVAVQTAEVRRFVAGVAERVESVFDDALAARRITSDAVFSFAYEEVRGARIRELGRLFDVGRVPADGFHPPKYATPWDAAVDDAIIAVLDDAFERAAFANPIVIAVSDLNGFMYAYPRRHINAWTGVDATDRMGNRVKRLIEEEHALQLVRTGLGPAAGTVARRAPYAAFERAGCVLERPPGERPWQLSVYARDVNDVLNDLAMPVFVRGRRHGAIRFGYDVRVL
jgi:methyl-accepting chemotaxis protein